MGWLGRIIGDRLPPGARLQIGDQNAGKFTWWVYYTLPGVDEDDEKNWHRIGPTFTDLGWAQRYRDWLEDPKGHPFEYPTGAV